MPSMSEKYALPLHFAIYVFSTVGILLLLYEQSQLSSRAGVQASSLADILVQQAVMVVLLGFLLGTFGWIGRRWFYVVAGFLFAGYAGVRLTAAFSETLGLVPTLEAKGVPISDYQGTFYLLSLGAAFSYFLSILLLRRAYGRLNRVEQLNPVTK